MAGYDHWKTTEPDPMAWDLRQEYERCNHCGADATEPCLVLCDCAHCVTQRLRVMDVDPENDGRAA